jgi:hypothetical protein
MDTPSKSQREAIFRELRGNRPHKQEVDRELLLGPRSQKREGNLLTVRPESKARVLVADCEMSYEQPK